MTDMLFMAQVPEYLNTRYGVRRTRRAVSYWASKGVIGRRGRVYLQTETTPAGERFTRKPWVDHFIERVSRRKTR